MIRVTTSSTTTKPSTIRFKHFVEHPASIFKNQKKTTKNYHNHKTNHNSVQTFCRTPVEHPQEPKKDNKNNKNGGMEKFKILST